MTESMIDTILNDREAAVKILRELTELKNKNKQLEILCLVKDQQVMELQSKPTYYDIVLQSPELISTEDLAKDFGMTELDFDIFLKEQGVQFKQNGVWFLHKKYAERGYTYTKHYEYNNYCVSVHTYWTQAGRLFIYDLLKQNGILPTVELE